MNGREVRFSSYRLVKLWKRLKSFPSLTLDSGKFRMGCGGSVFGGQGIWRSWSSGSIQISLMALPRAILLQLPSPPVSRRPRAGTSRVARTSAAATWFQSHSRSGRPGGTLRRAGAAGLGLFDELRDTRFWHRFSCPPDS